MAAQSTAITNIFEPVVYSKYLLEQTVAKSAFFQAGILGSDPEIQDAALKGGRTVQLPFWDDLAHDTGSTTRSKVATDTDDSIAPAGVTADYDVAVKHFRTQDFQVAPIVKYASGSDPAMMIVDRYATWWAKETQRLLLLSLKGAFADSTVASELGYDISVEEATTDPTKLIGTNAIETARFKLGDAYAKFTGIAMHSVPFQRLRNLDLIDFEPVSAQNPLAGKKPTYMGLDVIVDDGMTTTAGSTSGYKYDTFLFGRGAVAYADIPLESGDPNMELWREPKKGTGAGQLDIITRKYFILHPRGIKYSGSLSGVVSPSDSDLESDNWTKVYLTKNIRIARLRTNG